MTDNIHQTKSRLTAEQIKSKFVALRESKAYVTVKHPTAPWQRIGCMETLQFGEVSIRWHNLGDLTRYDHQPTSVHTIDEIIIL